jgi:arylsulfatase A-like enzyme/Tfp pilus assembly protein PilF
VTGRRPRRPGPPPAAPAGKWRLGTVVVALAAGAAIALGALAWRTLAQKGAASFSGKEAAPFSPNVLLVTIDTLRWDRLGTYGAREAATPVLDGIAARGVRFDTAIAQAPLTAPSHASILAGVIPPRHGVRDNGGFALPESLPTLAEAFQRAGYRTAAFVSGFPLDRRFGFARGFDHYDDRLPRGSSRRRAEYVERRADATTGRALQWLDRGGDATPGGAAPARPWFVWVHYFDPHAPYEPPPDAAARAPGRPYDGEIAFVDQQLGRLLAALERTAGGRDRTIVLVTADHGEALGEHGEETHGVFLYDATLRVPWVMEGPGVSKGTIAHTIARGVDVMPTLLDLAGVEIPGGLDGRSLAPAARGGTLGDEPAYAESLFARIQLGWSPLYAWRTSRWKVIDAPRPELYAIDRDPGETSNRAVAEGDTAARLLRQLRAVLEVPTPEARVTPDRASAERLRALGYASGGPAPAAAGPAVDPKDRIALVNRMWRGMALIDADPASAARELAAVLADDPDVHIARRYLAVALANGGDRRRAAAEIERLARTGSATADDYLLLADWRRSVGDAAGARAALDEASRRDPRSPEPVLAQARAALDAHDLDAAAAAFARVLELSPGHGEALRGTGEVAMERGDLAGATLRFEQIVAADADDAGARVRLGVLRARAGRLEEALALFRAAVALDPADGEALLTLGGALAKMGRPGEAVPYFERAVEAGLRTPVAFNSLGAARMESGDRAGALSAFRESLEIAPAQPAIRDLVTKLSPRTGSRP